MDDVINRIEGTSVDSMKGKCYGCSGRGKVYGGNRKERRGK